MLLQFVREVFEIKPMRSVQVSEFKNLFSNLNALIQPKHPLGVSEINICG